MPVDGKKTAEVSFKYSLRGNVKQVCVVPVLRLRTDFVISRGHMQLHDGFGDEGDGIHQFA